MVVLAIRILAQHLEFYADIAFKHGQTGANRFPAKALPLSPHQVLSGIFEEGSGQSSKNIALAGLARYFDSNHGIWLQIKTD